MLPSTSIVTVSMVARARVRSNDPRCRPYRACAVALTRLRVCQPGIMANRKPLIIGLVVLAVVFVALAVLYFTRTAQDLPSWLPGHQAGSTRHHAKHGVAMIALALASCAGVWMLSGPGADRAE